MTLPHQVQPVDLQVCVRTETLWTGQLPVEFAAVPNKRPYILEGRPHYPELLIVALLTRGGWNAAWRKSWNGDAWWRGIRQPVAPPEGILSIIAQVSAHAGHTGQWDILAWRGRQLRLIGSRRAGGQRISAYQAAWLDVALRMGLPIGCFAIVEHLEARPARRRRLEHVQAVRL